MDYLVSDFVKNAGTALQGGRLGLFNRRTGEYRGVCAYADNDACRLQSALIGPGLDDAGQPLIARIIDAAWWTLGVALLVVLFWLALVVDG